MVFTHYKNASSFRMFNINIHLREGNGDIIFNKILINDFANITLDSFDPKIIFKGNNVLVVINTLFCNIERKS